MIMFAAVIAACLGVHLGLFEAICKILSKIASCAKCSSFWLCVLALLSAGADIIAVVALSLIAAYLSNWVAIILVLLNDLYERVWQRIRKR